jgi:hypothetical protein
VSIPAPAAWREIFVQKLITKKTSAMIAPVRGRE